MPIRCLLKGAKHRRPGLRVRCKGGYDQILYLLPLDSQLQVYGTGAIKLLRYLSYQLQGGAHLAKCPKRGGVVFGVLNPRQKLLNPALQSLNPVQEGVCSLCYERSPYPSHLLDDLRARVFPLLLEPFRLLLDFSHPLLFDDGPGKPLVFG